MSGVTRLARLDDGLTSLPGFHVGENGQAAFLRHQALVLGFQRIEARGSVGRHIGAGVRVEERAHFGADRLAAL